MGLPHMIKLSLLADTGPQYRFVYVPYNETSSE